MPQKMKPFIVHVTYEFDCMEWGDDILVRATNELSAHNKVRKVWWGHGDSEREGAEIGESQRVGMGKEIPEDHYEILKLYLMTYGVRD